MHRRGFTIVELIIVITIMGILLVLAVVNLRGAQVNARDDERKGDIESIGLQLESYYKTGVTNSIKNRYPSTGMNSEANIMASLPDADVKIFTAPGAANVAATWTIATINTQTTIGITPQPTIAQYVYQPLQQDGTLCTTGGQQCQKFNLYYRLESDNAVYMATSKNQ